MSDREYVKVNTSIRTGSNAEHLITDEDGNIQATIELRLPDDLFKRSTGTKLVNDVRMQTGKFRLSLENTPIAALPVAEDIDAEGIDASSCQLDVYPLSILDGKKLYPDPFSADGYSVTSLPYYKAHKIIYNVYIMSDPTQGDEGADYSFHFVKKIEKGASDIVPDIPESIINFLSAAKVFSQVKHLFNLCFKNNHGTNVRENNQLLIQNIGNLQQALEDALENAVTYALTKYTINVSVYAIKTNPRPESFDQLIPQPDPSINGTYMTDDFCLWRVDYNVTENKTALNAAFKPHVTLGADSLAISYDTGVFQDCIPILWTTPFVDTHDAPAQLSLNQICRDVWFQPPAKRPYKYNFFSADDGKSFSFGLNGEVTCGVMNIIANKEMKETFSFLPWLSFNFSNAVHFHRQITESKTVSWPATQQTLKIVKSKKTGGVYHPVTPLVYNLKGQEVTDNVGYYEYTFTVPAGSDPMDESIRANQHAEWHGSATYATAQTYTDLPTYSTQTYEGSYTRTSSTLLEEDCIEYHPVTFGATPLYTLTEPETLVPEGWSEYSGLSSAIMFNELNENGVLEWQWGYHPGGATIWPGESHYNQWIPRREPDTITINTSDPQNTRYTWRWNMPLDNLNGEHYLRHFGRSGTDDICIIIETPEIIKTTSTTRLEVITNITPEPDAEKFLYPNLDIPRPDFFVLDGTTARLNIEAVEPITSTPEYAYQTTVEVTTEEHNTNLKTYSVINGAASFTATTWPTAHMDSAWVGATLAKWDEAVGRSHYDLSAAPGFSNTDRKYVLFYIEYKQDGSFNRIGYFLNPGMTGIIVHNEVPDNVTVTRYSSEFEPSYDTVNAQMITIVPENSDTPDVVIQPERTQTQITREKTTTPKTPGTTTDTDTDTHAINQSTFTPFSTFEHDRGYSTVMLRQFPNSSINWSNPTFSSMETAMTPLPLLTEALISSYSLPPYLTYVPSVDPNFAALTFEQTEAGVFTRWFYFDITIPNMIITPPTTLYKCTRLTGTNVKTTTTKTTITELVEDLEATTTGNLRLTFTWPNLPMVVLSPIQSIVLTLQGVRVNQEYQPINITEKDGSSLTATFPIVENFYSLATTLRDLHDELVVVKDDFDSTATYSLDAQAGQERVLRLSAYYITKDGTLHQIYIPPNGVFSLQLIFGLSFYYTS